jgi:hypothetical protein
MTAPEPKAAKPVKPNLRPSATFSASWEVVVRQWFALAVLQLIYGVAPDALFWMIYGFAPSFMDMLPLDGRLAYITISFVAGSIFAYNATRITLSDQLLRRRLTLRDAARIPPRVIPGLLLVNLIIAMPMAFFNSLGVIGGLPIPWYLSAVLAQQFAVSVAMAFIGASVAMIVDEGVNGFAAIRRAWTVARGHRIALTVTIFAFNATCFLAQYGFAELVDRVVQSYQPEAPLTIYNFWRGLAWMPFSIISSMLWPIWMSVLYLALRRAHEGVASQADIDLFT